MWILGGYQTDFARNWAREGLGYDALVADVVRGTLEDAAIAPTQIEVVHVGNAFGQLYTGQGHLGAMPATVEPDLWGLPAARHEAACASGSIATLAATAELEGGRYDLALVVGAEIERNVDGETAARHLGAAVWVGHEGQDARYVWPAMFSDLADEYDRRYGIDDAHLRAISERHFANARTNPNAQTRSWSFGPASFSDDEDANPIIEGRTRRNDCSQITDGGAGIVVASDRYVQQHPEVLRGGHAARILGWGHRTVGLPLAAKFARSHGDRHVLPHVRDTVRDALDRARMTDIHAVDGVETHDCFAMSAYMAIDHLGITEPGENAKAIESGDLDRDGRMPMNPSGGLIGGGHPVGATGIRMLVDASRQVTARAEGTQVEGAERFLTLNIGGSTATTCAFVVGRA